MGQFCQRVVLVHELGQWGGTKELFDCSNNRTDVDQSLWSDNLHILCLSCHSFTNNTFHSGETDSELVLKQFADRTDSSVAQMVNVVGGANAVAQAADIVDGCKDIVFDDVFWNQVICSVHDHLTQLFIRVAAIQNFTQYRETYLFINTDLFEFFLGVAGGVIKQVNHTIGDNLYDAVTAFEEYGVNTCALDLFCFCTGQNFVWFCHHFTGTAVDDWFSNNVTVDSGSDTQFFVVFVTSNTGQVVSSSVKEQCVQMGLSAVYCWWFTWTQFSVNFQQSLFCVVGAVLFDGSLDSCIFSKEFQNLRIAGKTQGTDKGCYWQLSVFINTNIEDIVGVGFVLKPCAAVWNNCCREKFLTSFVTGYTVVHAWRTYQLGNDNSLRTIDNKCTAWCHHREITHEDVLFFYLACLLVQEACTNPQRSCICCIALFTLFDGVFGFFVKTVIDKVKYQIALIV